MCEYVVIILLAFCIATRPQCNCEKLFSVLSFNSRSTCQLTSQPASQPALVISAFASLDDITKITTTITTTQ